ncbi:Gfo/Idh/MocA family oxidoreductase [Galbibacter sp. BG1]|nr:Gfo/Idh/MocA family oxidoreductase [Galbibacter sp. BG1]
MKRILNKWFVLVLITCMTVMVSNAQKGKFRLAIDGLSHGHVVWVFKNVDTTKIDIVGIAEPNRELAERMARKYKFSMDLVYDSLDELIDKVKPEAVAAFNSTYEHLETVEVCAPKGIHVMVEKPLAVNLEHADKIVSLAKKNNIHVITNYETTWYPSNAFIKNMVEGDRIGEIRRIIVNNGHKGPQEINVNKEFLGWLTDPELNGGGAITDFGCYGANLILWLKKGEMPTYVYATSHTFKPKKYPRVDDDATILLDFKDCQGVIQPSWNWPYSRKDIEVYGENGYVIAKNKENVNYRFGESQELTQKVTDLEISHTNPFNYFKAVVRGEIQIGIMDLSGLRNNYNVIKLLDAARLSAAEGRKIEIN